MSLLWVLRWAGLCCDPADGRGGRPWGMGEVIREGSDGGRRNAGGRAQRIRQQAIDGAQQQHTVAELVEVMAGD